MTRCVAQLSPHQGLRSVLIPSFLLESRGGGEVKPASVGVFPSRPETFTKATTFLTRRPVPVRCQGLGSCFAHDTAPHSISSVVIMLARSTSWNSTKGKDFCKVLDKMLLVAALVSFPPFFFVPFQHAPAPLFHANANNETTLFT